MISKEILAQIKKLQIKTDRLASEILTGEYKSAFRGRGLNFDKIREYQIGDDLRLLDWKVTARMGQPFVRQYKEERQMTMMLVIDLSASNNFGTQNKNKKQLATELAAVLASLAVKNNDKVGAILFTDRIELYIPPKQGKAHIFRLIKDLMLFQAFSARTNLKSVLQESRSLIPAHSVVFLISDFLPEEPREGAFSDNFACERELKVLRRSNDLIAVSIRDPREFKLPNVGFIEIVNPERESKALLNLNKKSVRLQFEKVQNQYLSALREKLRSLAIDFLELSTDRAYVTQLMQLFLMRERRRH